MRPVTVIAHRGGALEAPENTLAAIRHGVAAGADYQEIDVCLSRDGHVVVIHDDTLERTTNGKGAVEDKTLAELKRLDAGNPRRSLQSHALLAAHGRIAPCFGTAFAGERIPTLNEALMVRGARLMIELKHTTQVNALVDATIAAVHATGMQSNVVLASFDEALLLRAHEVDPSLPLQGIADNERSMRSMLKLPVSIIGVSPNIAAKTVQAAPEGVSVWTWTVFTPRQARRLIEAGVDGIITDAPVSVIKDLRNRA